MSQQDRRMQSCHPWCVMIHALVVVVVSGMLSACGSDEDRADRQSIHVLAAASTTDVMTRIASQFEDATDIEVVLNFGSSSTLAKQIENGAPADVFLSANPNWMDHLEQAGLIESKSRFDLLSNAVVLIAPIAHAFEVEMSPGFQLADAFEGRLAMGDPSHVPAGMYARQAMERLGWWSVMEDRVVGALDVRAALLLVEQAAVSAGVVYATDAAMSDKVSIVAVFPKNTHATIVYPIALVRGDTVERDEGGVLFLEYLTSQEAVTVFEAAGFRPIRAQTPSGQSE